MLIGDILCPVLGCGAAGFEFEHVASKFGTPRHALALATAIRAGRQGVFSTTETPAADSDKNDFISIHYTQGNTALSKGVTIRNTIMTLISDPEDHRE